MIGSWIFENCPICDEAALPQCVSSLISAYSFNDLMMEGLMDRQKLFVMLEYATLNKKLGHP